MNISAKLKVSASKSATSPSCKTLYAIKKKTKRITMMELIIEENIKVRIIQLSQDFTYEGLLEGHPNEFINQMIIKNKENRAKKILEIENVYCLNPQEKNKLSDNKFELPSITCMALLKSNQVFKNHKMDFSCLGLIWFQENLAFPLSDEIIEQIKKVQFKELCSEYEQ